MSDPLSSIDLSSLRGRIAVVTGATRGIGEAVALCLAGHGAHVIAIGRKVEALEALDDKVRAEEFRRRVLKGLSKDQGGRLSPAIRRYAEGLLR